jgi:hypothetical protein
MSSYAERETRRGRSLEAEGLQIVEQLDDGLRPEEAVAVRDHA